MEIALEQMYNKAKFELKDNNIKGLMAIVYCYNVCAICAEIDNRLWLHFDYQFQEWRVEKLPSKRYYEVIGMQ